MLNGSNDNSSETTLTQAEECCGYCIFSNPLPQNASERGSAPKLVCRKNPPQVIMVAQSVPQGPVVDPRKPQQQTIAQTIMPIFPPVASTDWCGQFMLPEEYSAMRSEDLAAVNPLSDDA